jgi:Protein of unknown function (DUF3574)
MHHRKVMRVLAFAALGVMLAAQASAQTITCTANHTSMMQAELLFGRNIDGRHGVTERAWARFLAEEITPRFPDGLTVYDAAGQYRENPAAKIVRERSKIVMILVESGDISMQRIGQIVDAYKKRFRQKSVGVVIKPACVSF